MDWCLDGLRGLLSWSLNRLRCGLLSVSLSLVSLRLCLRLRLGCSGSYSGSTAPFATSRGRGWSRLRSGLLLLDLLGRLVFNLGRLNSSRLRLMLLL